MRSAVVAAVLLSLTACRDFSDDFQSYCDTFGCDAATDAGQLTITAETVPVRLIAGQCGIANLRVRFENGDPPVDRPQAEISFPAIEGRPQPSINRTNTCQEQISTVVIGEGRVTTPIFILDELAGSYEQPLRVYFPDTDRTVEGTLPVEVVAADPVRLTMTSAPTTARIGDCVGPFQASLFDRFGNAATTSKSLPLDLSTDSASGAFYSSANCADAIVDGGATVTGSGLSFHYSDPQLGSRQLRASSPTLDGGGALAVFELTTALPTRILIGSAPQDVLETSCSEPFSIEFSDSFGHRVPLETDEALTLSGGTLRFYSDAACGAQLTSLAVDAGAAEASFFVSGPNAKASETVTVGHTLMTPATRSLSIISAGAPRLTLSALDPQPFAVDGCNRLSITALLVDGGSAQVAGLAVRLIAPTDNDAGFYSRDDLNCSSATITSGSFDAGANVLLIRYRDHVAGTRLLEAAAPGLVSDSLSVNVAAGPIARVELENAPAIAPAGVCRPMPVRAVDVFGNPTQTTNGARVSGAFTLQSEQVSATANCAAPGTASFAPDASVATLYWSPRENGSGTFSVTVGDGGVSGDSTQVDVVPGPPAIAFVGPGYTVQQAVACGPTQYYVELRDKFSTPTKSVGQTAVSIAVASVQAAATCPALRTWDGASCGVETNLFFVPDGGTRANFKTAVYSQSSCTYNLTSSASFLASTLAQVRACRGLNATCANAGDCCSGTCTALQCK